MGIKISSLIPKREISWDELRDKKIAVDSSQMLYQFLSSIRQMDGTLLKDSKGNITSHLIGLSSRITNLMSKGLKLVFVFDGISPKLKSNETERRSKRKEIAEIKFEEARKKGDEEKMYKYSQQTARLDKTIIEDSKEFIAALGLPVIQAPSEAEAQAAFMAERKDVDYVASSDFDTLVYGAPRLLQNLTLATRKKLPSGLYVSIKPELIELRKTLKELKINKDQFLALAILIGTDFNPGGVKQIGPKTALRIVREHKSFDKIFKEVNAEFDWKEIYAVFKSMPIMKNYQLKWKNIDEEKVYNILVKKHDFSKQRVEKLIKRVKQGNIKRQQKKLGEF